MRLEGKRGKKGKVIEGKRGIVAKTGFANLNGFESKTVMNSECSIGTFDWPVRFARGEGLLSYSQ